MHCVIKSTKDLKVILMLYITYTLRCIVFFCLTTSKSLTCMSRGSVPLTLFIFFSVAPSNLFNNVVLPDPSQPTMIQRAWQTVSFPSLINCLSLFLSISSFLKFFVTVLIKTFQSTFDKIFQNNTSDTCTKSSKTHDQSHFFYFS